MTDINRQKDGWNGWMNGLKKGRGNVNYLFKIQ